MKSFGVKKVHVMAQAEAQAKCAGTYSRHLDLGRKKKEMRNVTHKPQSIIFYIV